MSDCLGARTTWDSVVGTGGIVVVVVVSAAVEVVPGGAVIVVVVSAVSEAPHAVMAKAKAIATPSVRITCFLRPCQTATKVSVR